MEMTMIKLVDLHGTPSIRYSYRYFHHLWGTYLSLSIFYLWKYMAYICLIIFLLDIAKWQDSDLTLRIQTSSLTMVKWYLLNHDARTPFILNCVLTFFILSKLLFPLILYGLDMKFFLTYFISNFFKKENH